MIARVGGDEPFIHTHTKNGKLFADAIATAEKGK